MTCQEARKLLYDTQLSRREEKNSDQRASLFMLAKAHLHVCVACNEYFEREKEFVNSLQDRITHIGAPLPAAVFENVLSSVHTARLEERNGKSANGIFLGHIRSWFKKK